MLSQTGPSTRGARDAVVGSRPARRRPPERRQGHDPVLRPVERRPDELRHAGVEDDDPLRARPARARGARDATSQPARATRNRPGSTASRAGRRSGGERVEQRRELAGEAGGRGDRARVADREAAADVERVEAVAGPRR